MDVDEQSGVRRQHIIVFQQNGSGEQKIAGLRQFGADLFDLEVINIDEPVPSVLDDSSGYLPKDLACDLVLDFLRHSDLSTDLAALCARMNIPVVASARKLPGSLAFTPPTCCGLPRNARLGNYGENFGAPEFEVEIEDGKITAVKVVRGAPCGASWFAVKGLIGHPVEDAARKLGLETQFFCSADPSGWDPIYGKSPVHFAGKIHSKELAKAIDRVMAALSHE